ncbi:MAG TPA: riboflavin synthase [Cytophagales bacterium]|nr:riboflavin synthase [Cytophagales bacterium]HAA20867.1 riboflavin synthase [Cytophagales bacterium]HAP59156.1 riboflavin synthase [Cytophagales bacterium]
MFTGIIEALGTVKNIVQDGTNVHFDIESALASELKIDQSVSHNGVCLTVVSTGAEEYRVTAVDETLQKTNLGAWHVGSKVNLERSMMMGGRLDGHIVQGHVDQTGTCTQVQEVDGSWLFDFSFTPQGHVLVEKGSVCINGTSLTCFNVTDDSFRVAIIPYTFEHTNFHQLKAGDTINLEFDILGKYVARLMQQGEVKTA